jgi:D-alanyl-D-alanine carboxypeptidase (penicillin-binding protein 5/6)
MKSRRHLFSVILFLAAALAPLSGLEPSADAPDLGSLSAVLMDAATGTVLYAKNGNTPIPPASLTKLMTIHIALQEVDAGRASLDEIVELPGESWAANQPPRSSLMYLDSGQIVSLRELILGLAIPSGNDAAIAVALHFSPTVQDFVDRMNTEARRLGLTETRFVEPSGISEDNMTTAMEFAVFCREYIRCHPDSLRDFHSVLEFAYPRAANVAPEYRRNVGTWRQRNHNTLLTSFEGVDGLKTGYIDEAGYNIALTAARLETRLIAVILGAPTWGGDRIRDADGEKLLSWGFNHYKTLRPPEPEIPPARILDDPIIAPLPGGSNLGVLILSDHKGELRRISLVTPREIEGGNIFKRCWDSVLLFFRNIFSRAVAGPPLNSSSLR